jgi:hypothetical protein
VEHKTEGKCNTVYKNELQKTHYEEQSKDLLDKHCTTVYENKCKTKQEREWSVSYRRNARRTTSTSTSTVFIPTTTYDLTGTVMCLQYK